jgi:hypothetical protein
VCFPQDWRLNLDPQTLSDVMTNLYILYQRYSFIVTTICAYVGVKLGLGLGDDVAIFVANFVADLQLDRLRQEQISASQSIVPVVLSSTAIVTPNQTVRVMAGNELVLHLSPGWFFGYAPFERAFSLRYVAEDTDKFISVFSERLKNQFYLNMMGMLFAVVLLKDVFLPRGNAQVGADEIARLAVTLAVTAINFVFLARPYLQIRERNRTLLRN